MIVWVNGTFGSGQTSAARELLDLLPGSVLYDPETVGRLLRLLLPEKRLGEVADIQDLPSWRRLVVDTAAALLSEVAGPLVAPMTLLRQEYRDEIFGGLASRRIPVQHVLLHLDETILRERIAARAEDSGAPGIPARGGGVCDVDAYRAALPWLTEDASVIDAGALTPRQAAERIAEVVHTGAALREIVQTPEPTAQTLAAGVLLFDAEDRVLLVDPTYKPGWEFPGGVVEPGEPPVEAAVREVAEELGVELDRPPRLLVVDWEPPSPPGYGGLRLIFDGGRLEAAQCARLRLPGDELRGWRFVTESEAGDMLPEIRQARLHWALRARRQATVLNLRAGAPVGGADPAPPPA